MAGKKRIHLVTVEDDEAWAEALNARLSRDGRIEVVGSFSSAERAIKGLEGLDPDILLVDLGLPGISGIELISKVKWKVEGLKVLVLTASNDHDKVFRALRAGADGYLLKEDDLEKIADSVIELQNGGAPMNSGVARAIICGFHCGKPLEDSPLTRTEVEILGCLCEGKTYKEIAYDRGISWHTVNSHVRSIYEKLHASGRHEAITKARAAGIITRTI